MTENLKLLLALDARGITPDQQDNKMRNLERFGCVRMVAIAHDTYKIDGYDGFYNPYTDKWRDAQVKNFWPANPQWKNNKKGFPNV